MPEDRGLFPEKSILKNILYFAQLNGMDKATASVEADYWPTRFELQDRRNEQLKSLSKGNQQKVQLITAIAAAIDDPNHSAKTRLMLLPLLPLLLAF